MAIRSTGTLLEDALAFYKAHWQILLSIAIVSGVVQAVFYLISPTGKDVDLSTAPALMVFGLFVILMVVTGILSMIAMIRVAAEPTRYQSVVDAFMDAWGLFFPTLVAGILVALIVVAGFVLLIIPGIILAVWLLFTQYIVVLEGKRGPDALKASVAYVKGNWWAVFVRLILMVLLVIAASIVIGFVLSIVLGITGFGMHTGLKNAVGALMGAVLTPFANVYMYLMYADLKRAFSSTPAPAEVPPPAPSVVAQ